MAEQRVAVVSACGGMTAAYCGGVVSALITIADNTEISLGSSAGAFNAVALAIKSPCIKIVWRNIVRSNPYDPYRVLRWRYPLDYQVILKCHWEYMDFARLEASKTAVHVGVFCLNDGQTYYQRVTRKNHDWWLGTTVRYPVVSEYQWDGERVYVDGGTYETLAIDEAIRLGATKIIAIDSRPADYQDPAYNWWQRLLIFPRHPAAREKLRFRPEWYREVRRKIHRQAYGVPIYYIAPREMRLDTFRGSEPEVMRVYQNGFQDGQQHLSRVKEFIRE